MYSKKNVVNHSHAVNHACAIECMMYEVDTHAAVAASTKVHLLEDLPDSSCFSAFVM